MAVLAIFFFNLRNKKNIPKDKSRPPQDQIPALVPQWTIQGLIIGPHNFLTFCRLGVHPLHYTFSRPFERLVTTFWISWYYNMNQGTLLDHQMDPARLNIGDPCQGKSLQGPFKVHIDIFLDRP